MSTSRKRICVIGLGQFGHSIAVELAKSCDVLAIDRRQAQVDDIAEYVQQALCLDARDFKSLSSVVGGDFDEAIVSMGESMEASTLCVLHLKNIGVKRIHAKAVNEDHGQILQSVGADNIISPEQEAALRLASRIVNPNLVDFIPLTEDYLVMEITPPAEFYGHSLRELEFLSRFGIHVIAVKKSDPERILYLPDSQYSLSVGDVLFVIGRHEGLTAMREGKELGGGDEDGVETDDGA